MQVIVIRPNPSRRDDLIAELWERGTVGILDDDSRLRAYFPESLDVSGIVKPENGEVIEALLETEIATSSGNESNSEPVPLGERFIVLAESTAYPTRSERIPLSLPPSRAFGSGRHESTQLMVEAMEAHLRPGSLTIDVGCGSGILSEVARHLGASTMIACDTYMEAITTARETCMQAMTFLGSVDAVKPSTADVVLANISAKVVDTLAADLVRVARPDGVLLLSGFIQDRTPERFQPEKVLERNGWLCWICRPELNSRVPPQAGPVQPFEAQWW